MAVVVAVAVVVVVVAAVVIAAVTVGTAVGSEAGSVPATQTTLMAVSSGHLLTPLTTTVVMEDEKTVIALVGTVIGFAGSTESGAAMSMTRGSFERTMEVTTGHCCHGDGDDVSMNAA